MVANACGAEFRRVDNRDHLGKPAHVMVAERAYHTSRGDLWDALTNRERIPRWFLPIEGELKVGGRYQFQGNAGGSITRCDAPSALEITWEFAGRMSWVTVRLDAEGKRTRLKLEHIVPASDADDHWTQYGPGAVGIGWDLTLHGLDKHVRIDGGAVDHVKAHAWMASEDGKACMRACAESWAAAHILAGEDPTVANAMAKRTAVFYTGS